MALAPISSSGVSSSSATSAQDAYGLNFESLLQIILTQLTYQDPLKPMDNFQFVSQLGQFSQLQQSQILNDRMEALLSSQGAAQATGLLGKEVAFGSASNPTLTGTVTAISFATGVPEITIETTSGQTIAGLSLADVVVVRDN